MVDIPEVDLLLGAEFGEKCNLNESRTVEGIFLRNSKFGWLLSGPVLSSPTIRKPLANHLCCGLTIQNIDEDCEPFGRSRMLISNELNQLKLKNVRSIS